MAMVASGGAIRSGHSHPSGLADVVELILDKGLVIDAFVRISVIGIELITIDARIVVASVDTYLRFAEAVNRLDLTESQSGATIQDLQRGGAKEKASGALEGAKETISDKLPGKSKDREKEKAKS
jgi:gas vesicle structural protein